LTPVTAFVIGNPAPLSGVLVSTTGAGAQPGLTVSLPSAAAAAINGVLTLSFASNAPNLPEGYIDPAVRFASGGATTLAFTVPAGTSVASLPNSGLFQQGTVAGTITATLTSLTAPGGASVLPNPRPSVTVTVGRVAPVLTPGSVRIVNVTASGFAVEVQGHSTTRELSEASFSFSPASGASLDGNTTITAPISAATVASWFDSAEGRNNGSRFNLQMQFTFSGDTAAIGTVSVTLANTAGRSESVTGGRL
jgi:hypothetical protein